MDNAKKNMLLAVLGLLLAIKFVVQPWLAYLDEQQQELQTLTKKLNRSEALLQVQAEVEANEQALKEQTQQLLQTIALAKDAAAYRIEFQQQLQMMLESYQVQLVLFEWLSDSELNAFSASRGRVSLRLKGSVADIARSHVAMEQQMKHITFSDLKASWQGPLQPGHVVEMAVLIEVDYRVDTEE
jgi:hypothetical protein